MGSSQSKRERKLAAYQGRLNLQEQNSILAAIAANKRQRTVLMDQVRQANQLGLSAGNLSQPKGYSHNLNHKLLQGSRDHNHVGAGNKNNNKSNKNKINGKTDRLTARTGSYDDIEPQRELWQNLEDYADFDEELDIEQQKLNNLNEEEDDEEKEEDYESSIAADPRLQQQLPPLPNNQHQQSPQAYGSHYYHYHHRPEQLYYPQAASSYQELYAGASYELPQQSQAGGSDSDHTAAASFLNHPMYLPPLAKRPPLASDSQQQPTRRRKLRGRRPAAQQQPQAQQPQLNGKLAGGGLASGQLQQTSGRPRAPLGGGQPKPRSRQQQQQQRRQQQRRQQQRRQQPLRLVGVSDDSSRQQPPSLEEPSGLLGLAAHLPQAAAAKDLEPSPLDLEAGEGENFLSNQIQVERQKQKQHTSSSKAASASTNATIETMNNIISNINNNLISPTSQQQKQQPQPLHLVGGDLQRGLAFGHEERETSGLLGHLPAAYQDQELQIKAVINYLDKVCPPTETDGGLSKYIYLRNLKDFNERLFYAALTQNVEKLMPIVYTPIVGLACQKFSEIYLRPRGLFISSQDAGRVARVLANWPERDVRVIVFTDGERILGLGDLGANGMGISIGKLSLYTALAGIPPKNVLPVCIDVGTNNETYLKDPLYIGLRQKRVRGEQYEALIEEFMAAVVERWGRTCLLQFEDFANATAFGLLQKFRHDYCTFNDDIQGTASVCLSGLISAARLVGKRLADCSFLFYGAGEANLGTAQLLVMAMSEEGASEQEARRQIWLVDSKGLVVASREDLSHHKRAFAQEGAPQIKSLEEIVVHTKPLAIIGASAQGGAFSETVCRRMAEFNERPIIFALSNPTSKAECTADEAYRWTEGRCVFASGSPFEPVSYGGRTYVTGQGNNAYIFPGVGLAAIGAHVHSIPEETFLVAARALSDQLSAADAAVGLVYPSLSKIREVTLRVASRVLEFFYSERLASYRPEPDDKIAFLKGIQYDFRY